MSASQDLQLASVRVGEVLPALSIPITLQRLVMEAGANRDFSLIHHDSAVARATGAPDAFANTHFLMGMFERLIRDWAGPRARLRRLGPLRMAHFNPVGDTLVFSGVVESRDDQQGTVGLDLWAESERGRTVVSRAEVELV